MTPTTGHSRLKLFLLFAGTTARKKWSISICSPHLLGLLEIIIDVLFILKWSLYLVTFSQSSPFVMFISFLSVQFSPSFLLTWQYEYCGFLNGCNLQVNRRTVFVYKETSPCTYIFVLQRKRRWRTVVIFPNQTQPNQTFELLIV